MSLLRNIQLISVIFLKLSGGDVLSSSVGQQLSSWGRSGRGCLETGPGAGDHVPSVILWYNVSHTEGQTDKLIRSKLNYSKRLFIDLSPRNWLTTG